jgi:hypothetical protein
VRIATLFQAELVARGQKDAEARIYQDALGVSIRAAAAFEDDEPLFFGADELKQTGLTDDEISHASRDYLDLVLAPDRS